jgi:hypothetical protein
MAAERWRSRPSVAAACTFLSGEIAVEIIERRAYLDYMEAVDSLEFVHEAAGGE